MSKFNIKFIKTGVKTDEITQIHLSGMIDERANFKMYGLDGMNKIQLYLSDLKGFNSFGVREWIKWIGKANSSEISLYECPKSLIDQMNMVLGFLPSKSRIMSFYVPYSNDSGAEKNVLFTFGVEYNEKGILNFPKVVDEDGKPMEMDIVDSKYFKFLEKK